MHSYKKAQSVSIAPGFKRLVSVRNRWRFFLTILTLLCHAFFIGGITVYRDFFNQPIAEGATLTIGLVSAALVIVLFIVLEFVYIIVSHRKLDPLQEDVLEQINRNA